MYFVKRKSISKVYELKKLIVFKTDTYVLICLQMSFQNDISVRGAAEEWSLWISGIAIFIASLCFSFGPWTWPLYTVELYSSLFGLWPKKVGLPFYVFRNILCTHISNLCIHIWINMHLFDVWVLSNGISFLDLIQLVIINIKGYLHMVILNFT